MKRVYNNYFLVGIFALAVGGGALFLMLTMSGKSDAVDSYYSYFENVTGLGYGNPVYYEGYRVGQIEGINPETINGKLMFKTEYTLLEGWSIPVDSVIKIESNGLLSDTSLSIHSGKEKRFLKPGSEITGVKGDDIMATISQLANDFSTLNQDKITPLLDLTYERLDTLSLSLSTQVPEILDSTDLLIKDLNKLVNSANKLVDEGNIEKINHIIANVEQLSEQLTPVATWLEKTFNQVDGLIASGQELLVHSDEKVSEAMNIAIKMLDTLAVKVEVIANEFESASMNINEATETIRKKPSSLIFSKKSKIADEDL